LEDNGFRLVIVHDILNDRLENRLVCDIVNAVTEWEVDGIILALANTNVTKLASAREIFSVFVKGDGHDSVGSVERFLNTVTMMNVNVDVENSLFKSEELDYTENDIIDVAKSTGLTFFWHDEDLRPN
jgi:hypothetical protein